MAQSQRTVSILGGGTYSRGFGPTIDQAIDTLRARGVILAEGCFDFNRLTASKPTNYGRGGVRDVSPQPREILNAIGHAGSDEVAEENRTIWQRACHAMVDRVVQAYMAEQLVDGQCLWLQGERTGHRKPAEETLIAYKTRLPKHFVIAKSVLPDDFNKRERLREGHDLFVGLKDTGVVETTILTDNMSPFARTFTLDVQDKFEAKALASLIAAQAHFLKSSSLAEVGRSLGDYGAFVGMAFASRTLPIAQEVAWWRAVRGLVHWFPQRGSAEVENLILEAQEATKAALTDPHALAIEEHIDRERKSFFIIYTLPIPIADEQMWLTFSNRLRQWLANTYPTATPVFASGNGTPDPRFTGSYWVQASVLFPMPDVPAPVQAILSTAASARRRTRPTPAQPSPNGRVAEPAFSSLGLNKHQVNGEVES